MYFFKSKLRRSFAQAMAGALTVALLGFSPLSTGVLAADKPVAQAPDTSQIVCHQTIKIKGINIAYREAGDPANPTVVLLHGFPTSSHMFRNLIPELSAKYHVLAPDYPGFGNSNMPAWANSTIHSLTLPLWLTSF